MYVALVRPPHKESKTRGVGFYADRLLTALNKIPEVKAEFVDFSFLPWEYQKYDLVHFPYFDLFYLTFPPIRFKKTVVTLHDVTPLKFPEGFPLGFRGKTIWPIQKVLLETADAIVTDSVVSKKDIVEVAAIPESSVEVTLLAPDEIFKPIKNTVFLSGLAKKYKLPVRFVLYVGGVNWNKNLPVLAKACEIANLNLVTVGTGFLQKENLCHPESRRFKEYLEITTGKELFRDLGFIPTEDLVAIYNLATVYVQPSVYEGFGLPVLEAMACGCPVICGRNSSLIELGGGAAFYTDVSSPLIMAEDIQKVTEMNLKSRETGVKKSIAQAAKFSWQRTAQETYEIYQKVLER